MSSKTSDPPPDFHAQALAAQARCTAVHHNRGCRGAVHAPRSEPQRTAWRL